MIRQSRLLALVAGSMFAFAGLTFALPSAPSAQQQFQTVSTKAVATAPTSVARGVVKSISGSELVVSRTVKGQEKDLIFQLNANTQKQGDIVAGARVTVHYHYDNKQDVATMVRVNPAKAPAAKTLKQSN